MSLKRYASLIEAWPKDALKRQLDFKALLKDDLFARQSGETGGLPRLELQVKSIEDLLDNKYKKMYPITDKLMKPAGKPDYYKLLTKEIENGPVEPTFWQKVKIFVSN
ncbi:hypothetical protein V1517DRAFT_330403 [Lipomyces orientalis]|uniref:Uncharacterized protein n=1 Tax=Lipomyces orientalis TaxID=1233043 RepID=A0ACC3TGN5_9ASCO